MAKAAKSKPVAVNTPYQDVVAYVTLNDDKKAVERTLKTLKPRVEALIPEDRSAIIFERDDEGRVPMYRGRTGQFKVQRVRQDRRSIDPDQLKSLIVREGLYEEAVVRSERIDEDKVAALVKAGWLKEKDIAKCMVGAKYSYVLVTFDETAHERKEDT